jgi:hypothetical protein
MGAARARVAAALVLALGVGAGGVLALAPGAARAQHYVVSPNTKFPRLLYADSLTSVNDRCVVTQRQLNPQIPPVYVNGKPVGFC